MKTKLFFILLFIICFSIGCRKDIDIPNSQLEKLFGEWNWYKTSGGTDGLTYTPYNQGYNLKIKFTDKGIYKTYKNKANNGKAKYELTLGPTIFGGSTVDLITYYFHYGFVGSKVDTNVQSIKFGGNDTLVLIDESYDGYNHYYVRAD